MVRIGHTVLGEKGTKICVPIVGTTMKEILDATAVACNTPCHVVELRIDYFERAYSIDAIIELLMLIKPQLKGRGLLFTPSREVIVNRLIQMKEFLADVPKIAVMPHTTGDVLTLLEATAEVKALYPSDPIITMAMGELGVVTRTAGALFGNAMTFASAGKASAPGQIDVHALKRILNTIDVDGVFDEQQHKRVKVH